MKQFLLLFIITLICACSPTPGSVMSDGQIVRTPPQWVEFCVSYPDDPAC